MTLNYKIEKCVLCVTYKDNTVNSREVSILIFNISFSTYYRNIICSSDFLLSTNILMSTSDIFISYFIDFASILSATCASNNYTWQFVLDTSFVCRIKKFSKTLIKVLTKSHRYTININRVFIKHLPLIISYFNAQVTKYLVYILHYDLKHLLVNIQ